ncbi:MAG TPA: hypothetical protein PKG95_14365 [Anaerolineaceae bacterium]|nr:hypothetical protein [Anaerolineaceae bacterium]
MKNKPPPVWAILMIAVVDIICCFQILWMTRPQSDEYSVRFPNLPTPLPTVAPDLTLESLLLTPDDLQSEARVVSAADWHSADDHGAIGAVNVQLGGGQRPFNDWLLSQNIYRFNTPENAQADYAAILSRLQDFSPPADVSLPPLQAAEAFWGCTQPASRQHPYCVWIALYDNHVIELLAWVEPEQMSLEDLQAVITGLDARLGYQILSGGERP